MAGILMLPPRPVQHPSLGFLGDRPLLQCSLLPKFFDQLFCYNCIYSYNVIMCIILAFLLLNLLNGFGMTILNYFNDVFSALQIYILTRWQHLMEQNHKNRTLK